MNFIVNPSVLSGAIRIPQSKSQTQRALIFALLANGTSHIESPLDSLDTTAMIRAIELLGAKVQRCTNRLEVKGVGGDLHLPSCAVDAGNSGIILRFIGALTSLLPGKSVITGDHSIQTRRPVEPLLGALRELQVSATSLGNRGFAPIEIKGPLKPGVCSLDGQDSQPVSALIIASAFAQGSSNICVYSPGERPWIDLTLSWLDFFHIPYKNANYTCYEIAGSASISAFHYVVPGDFSSLLFPVVAALITKSSITIENMDQNDIQGDKKVLNFLQQMGANLLFEDKILRVKKTVRLEGKAFDVNDTIDALPILAVMGCFSEGETVLKNGRVARTKESDRIRCMATELKKMGADIEETEDGLKIRRSKLKGAILKSYRDHRIAMSLTIAALGAEGESVIEGVECIAKTYPDFKQHLQKLSAHIR